MTIIEKIKWKIRNKKENYPKCPWCGKRMSSIATAHGTWVSKYGDYKCNRCHTEVEIYWRHNKSNLPNCVSLTENRIKDFIRKEN